MFIINGIAYAGDRSQKIEVKKVKPLEDYMMIVTFSSGEQRLFEAKYLLEFPAFKSLEDETIFKGAKVEYGVVVWDDGSIDIAPETMYEKSYAYEPLRS